MPELEFTPFEHVCAAEIRGEKSVRLRQRLEVTISFSPFLSPLQLDLRHALGADCRPYRWGRQLLPVLLIGRFDRILLLTTPWMMCGSGEDVHWRV